MCRVLLADDDLVQLDLRKQVLESAGHEVKVAFSPAQTLRQLEPGWAKVLIMDLRFPDAEGTPDCRQGLALIRSIRERGYTGPLVVLSGWPEELYGQPEEKLVSRVMVKPVAARELLAAIGELALV
jgi:CheY-like chemotaxis protein